MSLVGSLHLGNPLADHRASHDELRLALGSLGLLIGSQNGLVIVTVDLLHIPAIGTVAGADILTLAHIQHGIEGDPVGIVDENQVIKAKMTRQRGGLARDTLLEAAVTRKDNDMVVENCVLGCIESGGSHLP